MAKNASLYKKKGRKNWYCSYFDVEKLERLTRALPWKVDDPIGTKRAVAWANAKSTAAAAFTGAAKKEVWAIWVPRFLDDRYRTSPKTHKRYLNSWMWLASYLKEKQVAAPAALNYNHVVDYIPWRTSIRRHCGKLISRNTALMDVKCLGIVMREAVRRGFATHNPCERTGLQRDPAKERPALTEEEIRLIMEECNRREGHLPIKEQWMTTSFLVALYTLCRLSSTQVAMTDVDFHANTITMRVKGRKLGEPKFLTIPIHPALQPRLQALKKEKAVYTCVLPPMASKEWWLLRKKLGIEHTCFHSTRVTGITQLWRAGVPESYAMRLAGHKSSTVHRIYQRGSTQDLAPALEKLQFPTWVASQPSPIRSEQQNSGPLSSTG